MERDQCKSSRYLGVPRTRVLTKYTARDPASPLKLTHGTARLTFSMRINSIVSIHSAFNMTQFSPFFNTLCLGWTTLPNVVEKVDRTYVRPASGLAGMTISTGLFHIGVHRPRGQSGRSKGDPGDDPVDDPRVDRLPRTVTYLELLEMIHMTMFLIFPFVF